MSGRNKEQQSIDYATRDINRQVIEGLLDDEKGYPLAFMQFNDTQYGKCLFLESDAQGTVNYLVNSACGVLILKGTKHLEWNQTNWRRVLDETWKKGWDGTKGENSTPVKGKHFSVGKKVEVEIRPIPYYDHANLEIFKQAVESAQQDAVERLEEIKKAEEKRMQELDPENILLFLQKTNHGEA